MNKEANKSNIKINWHEMLVEIKKRTSVSEIARALDVSLPTVRGWLKGCSQKPRSLDINMLQELFKATRFKQNPDTRQRIWQSLRIKQTAGSYELAFAASADISTVYRFLKKLTKAGYLQKISSYHRNEGDVWKIVRDTGPRAPISSFLNNQPEARV